MMISLNQIPRIAASSSFCSGADIHGASLLLLIGLGEKRTVEAEIREGRALRF